MRDICKKIAGVVECLISNNTVVCFFALRVLFSRTKGLKKREKRQGVDFGAPTPAPIPAERNT